jgi:uncharacterized protein (TIGR03086 family)
MDARIEDYLTNADRFTEVVEGADAWDGQSPCEEWTAADVLTHVVDTQRDFLGRRGADLPTTTGDGAELWGSHLAGVRGLVADEAFTTEEYDGFFGRTSVAATLKDFYGFDMMVHRWDLARAVGSDVTWTDAEMDALEANLDQLGDNLYRDGVCRPALEVAADAPRRERILGRMGRRA